MRIGLAALGIGRGARPDVAAATAASAERGGFATPWPRDAPGPAYPRLMTILPSASQVPTRIRATRRGSFDEVATRDYLANA
jgi:hypothetical protein